ncbi:MAG: Asp-tRNA(Asn)/Glu-tRNA(Gln) amidotransferase subunit GatB [Akkermansiaceae bacterium]|nr:Asp-tRNA(Asn)/Glu-tRNA(Gln) amidotransferase subunit GatB [Akkermansiaceae bacterium]
MPISDYLVTIGLEVHCQIKTATKMFCSCKAGFGYAPNTNVCPTCLGMPGALPVLNEYAIERTVLTGLMLGCSTPEVSKWDRKNYFYADMPKNYQTSQLDLPLCIGGEVPLYSWAFPQDCKVKEEGAVVRTVKLDHIHLEEDAAKLTHYGSYSLVDYNRGGTPLMEIVSAPDLTSPDETYAYLKSLQQILICGGISDADMEKGQMRCDVNVSLRPKGQKELGAKIEMKNINSMSAARRALIYEIARQAEELDMGIAQVQSTRRWDDDLGESIVMRTKENAHDYRYHTCPDLIPVHTAPYVLKMQRELPELPDARQKRLMEQYGLPVADANTLVADARLCAYFETAAAASKAPRKVANWLINTLPPVLTEKEIEIQDCPVAPVTLAGLVDVVEEGICSTNQAKEVLAVLWASPEMTAAAAAESLGFKKADTGALESLVEQVIANSPNEVARIREGNMKLINALTGQVMKNSNPKPNPKLVTEIITAKLGL